VGTTGDFFEHFGHQARVQAHHFVGEKFDKLGVGQFYAWQLNLLFLTAFSIKRASGLVGESVSIFCVALVIFNYEDCFGKGVQNFLEVVLLLLKYELLLEGLFEVERTIRADQAYDNEAKNDPTSISGWVIELLVVWNDELRAIQ